jgi:hypothetical protein
MDWNQVAWAAIGGAIGGALGGFLASRATNKRLKQVLFILPLVMLGQLAPVLMAQHPLFPTNKLEQAAGRLAPTALQLSSALAQFMQGKSAAEGAALTREKCHAGLKRLSPEDLELWNRLRLATAERNAVLCSGYWTGRGVTGQLLNDALNQMEQSDVDSFFGVAMRATVAELENKAFEPPPPTTFPAALAKIKEGLPREDSARLDRVVSQGANAAPEDGCWAVKVLMRDSARLAPPDQERFLRMMASL